jgi:hypothetical protein
MSQPDPTTIESALPANLPPEAVPFLREHGFMDPDRLAADAVAPDAPLYTLEGTESTLLAKGSGRPLVLIFGSYT